jgi:hypothetical protein
MPRFKSCNVIVAVENRFSASRVSLFKCPTVVPSFAIVSTIFLFIYRSKDYTANMTGFLAPLLIFAAFATLGVLFFGIITMARGGDFNLKYGNKIMRARIVLQASALLIFAIIMIIAGRA